MQPFSLDKFAQDYPAVLDSKDKVPGGLGLVLELYYPGSISSASKIETVKALNRNSQNFKIGEWLVKILKGPRAKTSALKSTGISQDLSRQGIPVPRFLANSRGNLFSEVDLEGQDAVVTVQQYIKGRYFNGSQSDFTEILNWMDRIFSAKLSNDGGQEANMYEGWKPAAIFDRVRPHVLPAKPTTEFESLVSDRVKHLTAGIESAQGALELLKSTELHHIDIHPHNLLMDESSKLVALLDLESFRPFPKKSALAFGLFKLGRKSISKGTMTIDGFRKEVASRWNAEELWVYANAEILRRVLIILDLHVSGNTMWDFDLEKQLSALVESRIMFLGADAANNLK